MNDVGQIVKSVWDGLLERFPTIELDQFVIMPNHLHGILVLVGAQFIAPTATGCSLSRPCISTTEQISVHHIPTLGTIIHAFKAVAARQIRLAGFPEFRWQRNYYEHIIRDEDSLKRIREYILANPLRWQGYILANPLRWQGDQENPQRTGVDDFDLWLTEQGRDKSRLYVE